jgi:hypothetical protein
LAYRPGTGMTDISMSNPMYPTTAAGMLPAAGEASPATPPSSGVSGCDAGCGCGGGGCNWGCGGDPVWHGYGDFLYLRPRNAGMEFAVPVDPTTLNQTAMTFVMNQEFAPGFRVGASRALNACSEIAVAYTYYRGDNATGAEATGTSVLQPLVFSPFTPDADPTNPFNFPWAIANAHAFTTFQYADVDFRHSLWGCDCSCLNYIVGVRYATLGQEFDVNFADANANNAAMQTNVNFDGVGLRLGLDGERAIAGGFYASAKAVANFIGGEFRANYMQGDIANALEINTSWREARFVTILEAEAAVGWQSPGGRFRASVGYMLTDWVNAVKPSDYVTAVQTSPLASNPYHGANLVGTTALVFDGLTGHVELTW